MFVVPTGPQEKSLLQLPDFDKAEEIFRIKYKYAVSHAKGMERLAFAVLPYSLLRSFALTFDPTRAFKITAGRIAPLSRTRTRHWQPNSPQRKLVGKDTSYAISQNPNAATCTWTPAVVSSSSTPVSTVLNDVPKYTVQGKDTTKRSRPVGADMGEFEIFNFTLSVPDRHVNRVETSTVQASNDTCSLTGYSNGEWTSLRRTEGGCAIISKADVDALRVSSVDRTKTAITNRLSKSLTHTLASSQRYTLARNVIELKDLPRSILSLERTLRDFERTLMTAPATIRDLILSAKSHKHIPEEWLSFWFGWVTTVKALKDLFEAPERIAKDINFLIARKGLPTTVRRSVKFAGEGSTTPAFTFNPGSISGVGWSDVLESTATTHTWHHEVRVVVNQTFDFPEVGIPQLRRDLFKRKFGLAVTPADIYNLMPWSWLVDWFTGLGNYVELIDTINTDRSLINWGIVTGVTTGKITTRGTCKYDNVSRSSLRHNLGTPVVSQTVTPYRRVYEPVLQYECIVRQGIPESFGVRQTLKPEQLTPYQQSIIGAILQQRANKAG